MGCQYATTALNVLCLKHWQVRHGDLRVRFWVRSAGQRVEVGRSGHATGRLSRWQMFPKRLHRVIWVQVIISLSDIADPYILDIHSLISSFICCTNSKLCGKKVTMTLFRGMLTTFEHLDTERSYFDASNFHVRPYKIYRYLKTLLKSSKIWVEVTR